LAAAHLADVRPHVLRAVVLVLGAHLVRVRARVRDRVRVMYDTAVVLVLGAHRVEDLARHLWRWG
jgi:hypothetical protein